MISRDFPPVAGGIGYYVHNLSKKLVERGHRVTVITQGSMSKTRMEMLDGIEVFRAPFFPLYPFHIQIHGFFVDSLFRKLEPKLTLVHLHTPMPPPIETSLPVMTTVHTSMKADARYHEVIDLSSLAERLQSMFVYPRIELKLLRASMKITAVSQSVAKELKEYGLDIQEITVVGNGVDEKTFVPLRNRNCTEKYVLFTGFLKPRKGLFDLIECAEYVCRVYSDVNFVICGTGPFLRKLEQEIRSKGLHKRILLLGYVNRNKLIQTFQNATVQVLPSHYEGLPTVLLEAMSCGVPVVATDVGGNSDVISSGVNGFLVPPKCPEEMAKIVMRLIDDASLRENIGRAARKTIEKYYTWDKIADNILKCYENMLQE
jgi:glycosyltransferase involved in cell wall biosynthesis